MIPTKLTGTASSTPSITVCLFLNTCGFSPLNTLFKELWRIHVATDKLPVFGPEKGRPCAGLTKSLPDLTDQSHWQEFANSTPISIHHTPLCDAKPGSPHLYPEQFYENQGAVYLKLVSTTNPFLMHPATSCPLNRLRHRCSDYTTSPNGEYPRPHNPCAQIRKR